jgi:hypothetical protein
MHRCSKPGGCLSALAKRCPELLDALRERLVKAVEGAKGSRARDDLLPERRAAKRVRVNAQAGKVSASPAMEQALAAMTTIRGAAPPTPAAEATAAWQQLQQQGVCVKGCRAFCQGLCGSSNDFGYNKLQRGGGVSRAVGFDAKRRGDGLMPPEQEPPPLPEPPSRRAAEPPSRRRDAAVRAPGRRASRAGRGDPIRDETRRSESEAGRGSCFCCCCFTVALQ